MIKFSCIIPAYRDPYIVKTIEDALKNSGLGEALEIIAVFDGFVPDFKLVEDPRVRYIFLGKNRGMRGAINAGVAIARGEFIGRLDEHCSFGERFDLILTESCKENEVMTARRYYLNPVEWKVMVDKGFVDYEDLVIQRVSETVRKFAGKPNREKMKARKDILIDETQAMQGSFWIANRKFFLKTVGELQTEGFGPLIQDSVEVTMKYWQAGGRLMVNKNTWFAHKHRSFSRTHNNGTKENPANCDDGYTYALQKFEDYYTNELKPKWEKKKS
jgi:hypothetical protein